jgi:hypothetical protein
MSQLNINDLTIGQAKELANFFNKQNGNLASSMIGKYVIVRSRNEGINAGHVEQADDTGIVLTDARRIWYHRPENKAMAWYEGVAVSGLSSDSRLSTTVKRKVIIEDYSITECSDVAAKSILEYADYGQN